MCEVLWEIDVLRGRHIHVFDRTALRREILRGAGALIRASDSNHGMVMFPGHICLGEKLADARRDTPIDRDYALTLALDWSGALRCGA